MALSQLPVHHITSNAMAMGRSRSSRDSKSSMPQLSDKAGDFLGAPSKFQTMLKNTTEIGDEGPFSIKPSRFPQATPRVIPTHNLAGQQDTSRRSFSKQRYGDTQYEMSASYPSNLTSSSLVSLHLTQNQRSYRPLSRGPTNDDERSFSISRSSHTNWSGASPRLHSSHRLQGQGDTYGLRPRSPYPYPTRLKRLGYRPSSPAYSDFNRPFHPPPTGFYPEAGFHTRSPMSTPKRVPSVLQPGLGYPDADFSHRPFSPSGEPHRLGSFSPSSTRVPTPGLPLADVQALSQSREALISNSVYPGWDSRRSASPLPVFYDYTEAFEEKSHFSVPLSPDEGRATTQDDVKPYHEVEGEVRLTNSFVETETLIQSSYQEKENNFMEKGSQSLTESPEIALGVERRSVLMQQSSLMAPSIEEHEPTILTARDRPDDNLEQSSTQHVQSEGSSHLLSESPGKSRNSHHEAISSNPTASSNDRGSQSVSSGGSTYSVQSSARPENSTFSPGSADTVKPSTPQNQSIQSSKISRIDLNTPIQQLPSLGAVLGDSSLDRWSESEPSEIHSPTPISSPSRRRMFNRIFSIGRDLIGDSESDIAPKQVGSDQNTNVGEEEITIDIDKIEAITASRLEHTSMSLPALRAAREDQGDVALRDALMKARGSLGDLSIHTSTKLNDNSREASQHQAVESTSNISTLPEAQKPAASEYPATPTEEIGSVTRTATARDEEPNNPGVESALHSQVADVLSLPSYSAFESYSPHSDVEPSSLPYSFVPTLASKEGDASEKNVDAQVLERKKEDDSRRKPSHPILNLKKRADKASIESLPGSRPWNLAASYPWTDEDPKLDVKMPDTNKDSQADDVKLPRFRLKIHRASSSTMGPVKLVKPVPPPLEFCAARKTSLSSDFFSSSTFIRKPRPSITITQNNSSHHIGPSITRSSGNLTSPLRSSIASPCISLVPPSPGLNLEVRSFFSDDSSQVQPKGSLRKRISQLRAMATRGTSSDDVGGAERGLLSSAMGRPRTSGRSIKQEGIPSEGLYNLRHMRWRLEEKVKGWLHRSKDKVLFWGGKMGLPGPNTRSGAGVYSGI